MKELDELMRTLKRRLKVSGISYRDVGVALGLSEASVKRLLSHGRRIPLERLLELSQLLGLSLAELTEEAALNEHRVHTLSEVQEVQLVSETRLLLVAVCALNHWRVEDIVHYYTLSEAECIGFLLRLERLGLIQLLPGNRIRLMIARDFDWRPQGPIRHFFQTQGLPDFLAHDFGGGVLNFSHAMLNSEAQVQMHAEIRKLRQRFEELHTESLLTPLEKRHGTALLVAMRSWSPPIFSALRRVTNKTKGRGLASSSNEPT